MLDNDDAGNRNKITQKADNTTTKNTSGGFFGKTAEVNFLSFFLCFFFIILSVKLVLKLLNGIFFNILFKKLSIYFFHYFLCCANFNLRLTDRLLAAVRLGESVSN